MLSTKRPTWTISWRRLHADEGVSVGCWVGRPDHRLCKAASAAARTSAVTASSCVLVRAASRTRAPSRANSRVAGDAHTATCAGDEGDLAWRQARSGVETAVVRVVHGGERASCRERLPSPAPRRRKRLDCARWTGGAYRLNAALERANPPRSQQSPAAHQPLEMPVNQTAISEFASLGPSTARMPHLRAAEGLAARVWLPRGCRCRRCRGRVLGRARREVRQIRR
ncbi:hypothetical protein APR12_005472 [Nocardia amikacinitolerans]|nr:hypothetical protein [Nocardia amikacinitolerans]